ncbi:MAG: PmoA family protein [Verrucomicrobiota bacterium]
MDRYRPSLGMRVTVALLHLLCSLAMLADEPIRHEIIPYEGGEFSFQIDGIEAVRFHSRPHAPRPFFFPVTGPSGALLTRMGHPGAPNHDHHRSVWFGHESVAGENFWTDQTDTIIRQKSWRSIYESETQSRFATILGWYGSDQFELLEQTLIVEHTSTPDGGYTIELQSTFTPPLTRSYTELGKTNFGFLAIRMARSVSAHFGGGRLSNANGLEGESAIFGKQATWVDYSGPVSSGTGAERKLVNEGITCFDHPENPRYPTRWHVRDDGWMGPSFCFEEGYVIRPREPLILRYLLHIHSGDVNPEFASKLADRFAQSPRLDVTPDERPHRAFSIHREEEGP